MYDKKIQIGKHQWFYTNTNNEIQNESLADYFFSWGEFSTPTRYIKCDSNAFALRKCVITSKLFIECDFCGIDASDTIFIDCLFLNCLFKNANFHKASFIGSAIIQDTNRDENFIGAGMSQSQFKNSEQNYSILSNVNLNRLGFRHSVFESTIFNNISIEYTSFEDAYFNSCVIDTLNLKNSACRGIIINNCKIEKYISSFEKALGGIGILQGLKYCDDIELYFGNDKIDTLGGVEKKLDEVFKNFIREGKLFEFINIVNYLYKQTKKNNESYTSNSANVLLLPTQNAIVNDYPISERGKFLYEIISSGYSTINNDGKKISLDDILYSLKLMFFFDINDYILVRLLSDIYKNEMLTCQSQYSNFLIESQILRYFQMICASIKSNKYSIVFHNRTASWLNQDDRNTFCTFCQLLITTTAEENTKLISMHEGSIVIEFTLESIANFIILISILGCELKIEKGEVFFSLVPARGIKTFGEFIESINPLTPLLKNEEFTEKAFNEIKKAFTKIAEYLKNYIKKNKINGDIKQERASIPEIQSSTVEKKTIADKRFIRRKTNKKRQISNKI